MPGERVAPTDRAILAELHEGVAWTTGRVASRLFPDDANMASTGQLVRHRLADLERRGLVRRLDHDRPVIWCRTAAGTASLTTPPPRRS